VPPATLLRFTSFAVRAPNLLRMMFGEEPSVAILISAPIPPGWLRDCRL